MATRLDPLEASFISSLRALVQRGGSVPTALNNLVPPIAAPSAGVKRPSVVVEPRKGYWTQASDFSGTRQGVYPASPGIETVLGNDYLPGPPRGRGISLSRSEKVLGTPVDLNFMVWADIEFGIGSAKHHVTVDWCNSILNVPGSSIRVNARFGTLHTFGSVYPYNVGDDVNGVYGNLACQLSADPLVSKGYNTYTQVVIDPSADIVEVPDFAVGFFMGYLNTTVLTGTTKVVACYASSVYTTPPGPIGVGFVDSQAIIDNCYNQVNWLPQEAKLLDFSPSGLPSTLTVITWVMAV